MQGLRSFIFFGSVLLSTLNAKERPLDACSDLLKKLSDSPNLQPVKVTLPNGKTALFHNREIGDLVKAGISKEKILKIRRLLQARETFKIHLDANGYIVASDGRGSYAQAVWARDFARVIPMLEKSQRTRATVALLRMMTVSLNRELFYLNIRNTDVHRMDSEELRQYVSQNWRNEFSNLPFENTMYVPHIRFLLDQLKDPRTAPERWNMKQNDAIALAFMIALRGLESGDLSFSNLDHAQESYLTLALTYAVRTQFWEMFDSGAWEESNARRTSSVGLMTLALEKFQNSPFRASILERAANNELIPKDIKALIATSLEEKSVQSAIENGARIVKAQIPLGEAPERFETGSQSQRFSDAALAHLLVYNPSFITEDEAQKVIDHIVSLRRDSGILRYAGDVYLNLAQFEVKGEYLDQNLHKDRDASGRVRLEDLQQAYYRKDSSVFENVFGAGFEAQWVLGDALLVQSLPALIARYPNSARVPEWKALLEESFVRMLGFVTGEENLGDGPWALDGQRVEPFKMPEAWIPVRVYQPDGSVQTLWTPSKFTPLNWGTAELSAAFDSILNSY